MITNSAIRAPYYNYNIIYPQTLFQVFITLVEYTPKLYSNY